MINSQQTTTRRTDVLDRLVSAKKLTPDGARWLTLNLDPFHDYQVPVAGYPDADCFDTIVSARNYEYNLSKPAGSAGNWDAHIFTLPFTFSTMYLGTLNGTGQFLEAGAQRSLGMVNVAKDDTGNPLFPTADPVVSANFEITPLNASFDGINEGCSRVIGLGIEVIDTTAQLYKQGALVAYRVPTVQDSSCTFAYGTAAANLQGSIQGKFVASPPSSVNEAVLYRSHVEWEARQGCYLTVGQNGIDNPFRYPEPTTIVVAEEPNVRSEVALVGVQQACTALNAPPLVTSVSALNTVKTVNITQSGIFLTGLSNSATFKIRVRCYIERAPLRTDLDLIPLGTPSASFDSRVLELYSRLVHELPVAVPVSFNAKGDWWRMILNILQKVAPVVSTVLAPSVGPIAPVIGGLTSTIIEQLRPYLNMQNVQKKKTNANNNNNNTKPRPNRTIKK
jgi:hypothetical protein